MWNVPMTTFRAGFLTVRSSSSRTAENIIITLTFQPTVVPDSIYLLHSRDGSNQTIHPPLIPPIVLHRLENTLYDLRSHLLRRLIYNRIRILPVARLSTSSKKIQSKSEGKMCRYPCSRSGSTNLQHRFRRPLIYPPNPYRLEITTSFQTEIGCHVCFYCRFDVCSRFPPFFPSL